MADSFPSKNSSAPPPVFPGFKPLALEDRDIIRHLLWTYQPKTSELTFTNLFMWQSHHDYQWCLDGDRLVIISTAAGYPAWALPPVGPAPRADVCRNILQWLRETQRVADPSIERADSRLAAELESNPDFMVEPVRDHFDYVYRSTDLINLAGGAYQTQRNHINSLSRSHNYRYEPLKEEYLLNCLNLSERWCLVKKCEDDLSLLGELSAIKAVLTNYRALDLKGAVIFIDDRVQAFACGELLNRDTAVIHLEKADPELRGLYAVVNQQFTREAWAEVPFINREQDLGEPGLRKAKLSYHPYGLIEKFRIRLV